MVRRMYSWKKGNRTSKIDNKYIFTKRVIFFIFRISILTHTLFVWRPIGLGNIGSTFSWERLDVLLEDKERGSKVRWKITF